MRSTRGFLYMVAVAVPCLVVMIGCPGPSESEPAAPAPAPEGAAAEAAGAGPQAPVGAWVAIAIDGEPVPGGVDVTLVLDADGNVSGSTGCNRYSGTMKLDGASVEVGPLATTRMACPSPAMEVESAFERAISAVTRLERDDTRIRFLDDGGVVRLELAAATGDAEES